MDGLLAGVSNYSEMPDNVMVVGMQKQQIRISAKNLGQLALPDYCPRCFYIKLNLNNKLPWQIFPGIFSTIDSYSKKITWLYFEKYKKLPSWFDPYGNLRDYCLFLAGLNSQ